MNTYDIDDYNFCARVLPPHKFSAALAAAKLVKGVYLESVKWHSGKACWIVNNFRAELLIVDENKGKNLYRVYFKGANNKRNSICLFANNAYHAAARYASLRQFYQPIKYGDNIYVAKSKQGAIFGQIYAEKIN